MSEFTFKGRQIVALGERDGISGPALSAVIEASEGIVVYAVTECFV